MAHFQKYDRSSNVALGSPLLRKADSDKEEELQRGRNLAKVPGLTRLNKSAPDNDNNTGDEKEFNFLHNINKTEAKGILFDKPEGTWILYYTKDTRERIAFKTKDKVKQMEIISKPSGFAFNDDDDPVKLEELICGLQGQGVLKQQLSHFENEESEEEEN